MATGKRYYWLKLKESFMNSDTVDYFMGQPNGANYVVLYQMLCLKTINTNGRLSRQIGDVVIPYDVEKIQRDCKYFSADTIRVALNLYRAVGLIYEDMDGTLVLADHENLVGSETDYAEKNRRLRAKQQAALPPPGRHNVSDGVSGNVSENVSTDIDIEKDIDISSRPNSADAEPDPPKRKRRVYEVSENPYRAALYLAKRISENIPGSKPTPEAQLQNWADSFRLLHERDGYDWNTISEVLAWCQDDDFWKQNILSGGTFRRQFLKLLAKSEAGQ